MNWRWGLPLMALVCLAAPVRAAEETSQEFGARFVKAFVAGDIDAMETFYAPEVVVLAGSELLKKQWKLSPDGDKKNDCKVTRENLIKAYRALLADAGLDRWKKTFEKITPETAVYVVAKKDDETYAGVKAGDVILNIQRPDEAGAVYHYVLRRDAEKKWAIVMEQANY